MFTTSTQSLLFLWYFWQLLTHFSFKNPWIFWWRTIYRRRL